MFRASVRPGLELRILEERDAAAVFALVDRERPYLREWLPWVDATLTQDDTLAFIKASLEQFANNNGFAAGIWDTGADTPGNASGDKDQKTEMTPGSAGSAARATHLGGLGRFAGVIGTHKINWPNRKAEIGYWLGREFRGRGIVTEACRAVITHLLGELDLNRVEIHCATGNTKSCAIPRRLGFTHEGTLREGELCCGRYLDLNIFGMLQKDWHA